MSKVVYEGHSIALYDDGELVYFSPGMAQCLATPKESRKLYKAMKKVFDKQEAPDAAGDN